MNFTARPILLQRGEGKCPDSYLRLASAVLVPFGNVSHAVFASVSQADAETDIRDADLQRIPVYMMKNPISDEGLVFYQ
jgi:hypothetical protein